jgi:para-nitrobenzyl esterase
MATAVPIPRHAAEVTSEWLTAALAADVTEAIAAQAGLPATTEAFAAADPAFLVAASDAVRPGDHAGRWGPVAHTSVPFSPVVDGEVLPAAPWRAVAIGAGRDVDLIAGHNRDEFRLFTEAAGLRGRVTAEMASAALAGLLEDRDGEKAYRVAYPDADSETLFELVNSDWLFRMPSLHLAQAHAAAGGKTFLYELDYPAAVQGLGACHAIDVPLVFGVYEGIGRMLFGPEPPASAVALGDLMRSQWAAFAADGDPGWRAPGRSAHTGTSARRRRRAPGLGAGSASGTASRRRRARRVARRRSADRPSGRPRPRTGPVRTPRGSPPPAPR